MPRSVPTFSLYGETSAEVAEYWIHAESIPARSSLHNWEIKPHRHDSLFQILHIRDGNGEALLNGAWENLRPGSVVTVPHRHDHGFRFSRDIDGTVITFMARRLMALTSARPDFRRWLSSPRHLTVGGPDGGYLGETLDRIEGELGGGSTNASDLIEAYLATALILLYRAGGDAPAVPAATRNQARFEQLCALINNNFRAHRPVEFYARQIGLSAAHLNRITRLVAGKATSQLITDRLIFEAKRDLVFTTLPVQQIAYRLGFAAQAYFTRFFGRQTGLPPRRYREQELARLAG